MSHATKQTKSAVRVSPPPILRSRMTDRVICRLSAGWALSYDSAQWILMRAKSDKSKSGQAWRAIAFVGSTKAVLMRVLREKGVEIAPGARAAVDTLPATFLECLAIHDHAAGA